MRASRILPLARTSRWAMVASGTRKARAISAVVSPPSSRSVSATWGPVAGAGGERRVAAGEDQAQPVVAHRALLGGFALVAMEQGGLGVPVLAGRLPAEAVDRPVAGGGDDPPGGAGRQPCRRPPLHRRGEGVLDRLLGDVDVAEDADQDRDRAAVLLAEHPLDLRGGQRRHGGGPSPPPPRTGAPPSGG